MPVTFDLFVKELDTKKNLILNLFNDRNSPLLKELKEQMTQNWIARSFNDSVSLKILATDSSRFVEHLNNGLILNVSRAISKSNDRLWKKIRVNLFYSSDHMNFFESALMEHLEHLTILDSINDGFEGTILIDGSIYGRLSHRLIDLNIFENEQFMLEYFQALFQLLDSTKLKNIPMIGISKSSSASFLRSYFVSQIFDQFSNQQNFDTQTKAEYKKLLESVIDVKRPRAEILNLSVPDKIKNILLEYMYQAPDHLLLKNFVTEPGYSRPLMLGPTARLKRMFVEIERDQDSYVSKFLSYSSKEHIDAVADILKKFESMPAVVSFHVLPAVNDTPLRIDVPAWTVGHDAKMRDLDLFPVPVNSELEAVLKLIGRGYAGLKLHNVWLADVDRIVRMDNNTVQNLYLPQLYRYFQDPILESRGDRRARIRI